VDEAPLSASSGYEPHIRFREARERRGLSREEFAKLSGLHYADVCEIEEPEGDLTISHSPRKLQEFCRILGIRPAQLSERRFLNLQFPKRNWRDLFARNVTRAALP
jgi:transcriptional regulator with XRE-family HTH domain